MSGLRSVNLLLNEYDDVDDDDMLCYMMMKPSRSYKNSERCI